MENFNGQQETRLFPGTTMPDADWWSELWPDPEAVLRELGVRRGESAVDLCCGDGLFTTSLVRLASPARVYALDLDPGMIEEAIARVSSFGESCLFIQDDARCLTEHLPEPTGFVLLANTFHGVPDKAELARSARDALEPEGRFAVVNWHPAPREETTVLGEPRGPATDERMSVEQTRDVVERVGFKMARVVELPPYHYGAIFVRKESK